MKITVLTLFKEMYSGFLNTSIINRVLSKGQHSIELVDIRDYSNNKHHHVDDTPYGGGAGMLMKVDIVHSAIKDNLDDDTYILLTSPKAKPITQSDMRRFASKKNLMIVCGHYEGIDSRIERYVDEKISIGDYILTGGELASMVVCDGVLRLLDESISSDSLKEESYDNGLLEYPQYTRPLSYDGVDVPFVLTNGNHRDIARYNLKMALKETMLYRPDLLERELSKEEKELMKEIEDEL